MTDGSIDEVVASGHEALTRGAWRDARSTFEDALASEPRPEAFEGLSWAAWWMEDVTACLEARECAYRGYREAADLRAAARMALWLGDDHLEFRGAHAVAGGWFARAARILEDVAPCPEHGWLAVFEAHAALGANDLESAEHLAVRAREAGRSHGAIDLEMFALATEGVVCVERGELAHGLRCLDEGAAAALSGEYDNLAAASWACCLMMSTCERVRDYERAAQWCRQVDTFSRRMDARFLTGVCRTHHAVIRAWQGSWDDAEEELLEALDELTTNRPVWRSEAVVRLGHLRRRQGRRSEARELFEQAGDHPLAVLGVAALHLDLDEPTTARELLEAALRRVPPSSGSGRADVLELLVRAEVALGELGPAAVRLDELRAVAAQVTTEPLRAAIRLCEGLVAATGGDHGRACRYFEDAVALFGRNRAPVEVARARTGLAASLLELGRPHAAEREARRALEELDGIEAAVEREDVRALLEQLEGGREPSRAPGHALTTRQVEVLGLIAEGLSDQAIADRLVLSPHTVHRHVANIYARLDCSSRAAAVATATRRGLL